MPCFSPWLSVVCSSKPPALTGPWLVTLACRAAGGEIQRGVSSGVQPKPSQTQAWKSAATWKQERERGCECWERVLHTHKGNNAHTHTHTMMILWFFLAGLVKNLFYRTNLAHLPGASFNNNLNFTILHTHTHRGGRKNCQAGYYHDTAAQSITIFIYLIWFKSYFGTCVYSDKTASEVNKMPQGLVLLLHHRGNEKGSQSREHVHRAPPYETWKMGEIKSQC